MILWNFVRQSLHVCPIAAIQVRYKLIGGGFVVTFGTAAFLSPETAQDLGGGKFGYFTSGGLNAVIIPEPSAVLLGCISALLVLRRRR